MAVRIAAKAWAQSLKRTNAPTIRRDNIADRTVVNGLSQRDRHHFHSYRLWFQRLRIHGPANVPPLDLLRAELLRGPRKRPAYPEIDFPARRDPTVSIVITVHNNCEFTYRCLCSLLFAYNETSFEVIIVDNGSFDETIRLGDFVHGIEIVRHPESEEFGRAVGWGAARARGEFVLVMNNCSEVCARWLDELVAAFRNFERVGVAGSKAVRPQDDRADNPLPDYMRKVDCVPTAAWMVSRTRWKVIHGSGPTAPDEIAANAHALGLFSVLVPTSVVYLPDGDFTKLAGSLDRKTGNAEGQRKSSNGARLRHATHTAANRARDIAFRVLFIEQEYPLVDRDAGGYAAFQEMRLLQALGAKVSFLPRNLAWMGRHTIALQRIGVECLFAPYVEHFARYVRRHARDYDMVYVARHKIAEQVIPLVREAGSDTKIVFNLADLHFLREQREAALGSEGYSSTRAAETRRKELATIAASDLTFSYSDAELDILRNEVTPSTRLARMPWVVDTRPRSVPFPDTKDILFLGSFIHPPNSAAATYFARQIMPLLRETLPDAVFNVVGSGSESAVPHLASDRVRIVGHVAHLGEWFGTARVFVAPLLAGAGLKGKVLDALSHGVPSVLSPIAAEGTGLTPGIDCLIADSAEEWADCVLRLYVDGDLWTRLADGALRAAKSRFSFADAVSALECELAGLGLTSRREWGLPYLHARPDHYACELETNPAARP